MHKAKVPLEQAPSKLNELALWRQRLLDSVRSFQSDDLDVRQLKAEASAAIERGPSYYDQAEEILKTAAAAAEARDKGALQRARDIAIQWRGQYGNKVDELRRAGERAREWSRQPPTQLSNDVVDSIVLAAAATADFEALRIGEIEYAADYGLNIHPTVFWGQALSDVRTTADNFTVPELRVPIDRLNAQREREGLEPLLAVPDAGAFEMIARVLESAVALTIFNIEYLPRGYVRRSDTAVPGTIAPESSLLLANLADESGLHLIAVDGDARRLGTFLARGLPLHVLCSQRNKAGAVDLVGGDFQHAYYWQMSGQTPVGEIPLPDSILAACFTTGDSGAPVAAITKRGAVQVTRVNGAFEMIQPPLDRDCFEDALIWVDQLYNGNWSTIALTNTFDVTSGLRGEFKVRRTSEDLWNAREFADTFWWGGGWLHSASLSGLPCTIVERRATWGSAICFLDPKTLVTLRPPLALKAPVSGIGIARRALARCDAAKH